MLCTELVAVAEQSPEPGCVGPGGWSPHESELPDAPWSRNEQKRAPNELQAANPQTGFSAVAQSTSALPSLTQQRAPPSAPLHRSGPTRMSPVGTGPLSKPGEDTGASRDCLLWQITSPLRQPPGWPHLPSTPAGVSWESSFGMSEVQWLGGRQEVRSSAKEGTGTSP